MAARVRCPQCQSPVTEVISRKPDWIVVLVVLAICGFALWIALANPFPHLTQENRYVVYGALGVAAIAILIFGGPPIMLCRSCLASWNERERRAYDRRRMPYVKR